MIGFFLSGRNFQTQIFHPSIFNFGASLQKVINLCHFFDHRFFIFLHWSVSGIIWGWSCWGPDDHTGRWPATIHNPVFWPKSAARVKSPGSVCGVFQSGKVCPLPSQREPPPPHRSLRNDGGLSSGKSTPLLLNVWPTDRLPTCHSAPVALCGAFLTSRGPTPLIPLDNWKSNSFSSAWLRSRGDCWLVGPTKNFQNFSWIIVRLIAWTDFHHCTLPIDTFGLSLH